MRIKEQHMSQPASPSDIVVVLRMLTDPTRWRIYVILRRGSASVGVLAAELQVTEKLVSHHLQVMRRAGIVHAERDASDARWVYYHLDVLMLATLHGALAHLFDPALASW